MAIDAKVLDDLVKDINKSIEGALNMFRINPSNAKDRLTHASDKLERLAIYEGRSITEYPQHCTITIAWNSLRDYSGKYH